MVNKTKEKVSDLILKLPESGDEIEFKNLEKDRLDTSFLMEFMNIDGLLEGKKLGNLLLLFPDVTKKVIKGGVEIRPTVEYVRQLELSDGAKVYSRLSDIFLVLRDKIM